MNVLSAQCQQCGAELDAPHIHGCSLELCAYCGGQAIACQCAYELSGLDPEELDEPPEEAWRRYDEIVESLGGPIPWTGEYPGSTAAEALGVDLNTLHFCIHWNRETRQWEHRGKSQGV